MPSMTIDGRPVPFSPGQTIMQAAAEAGIAIPSLCSLDGIEPPTSCFVCVVRIPGQKGMAPSCATAAGEGMAVESESDEVRGFRRQALELLLSEHAGDCEAPCRRICPAGLDIPVMARHVSEQNPDQAAVTVWERMPLPGVLGYVCPAPCEKGCRRASVDGTVSIRELHRIVGRTAAASGGPRLHKAPATGKRVAIIGAGPAGLSCAFYLALAGHACTVYDDREQPGGMLRYGIEPGVLPENVLDREIGIIRDLGVVFQMQRRIGGGAEVRGDADALIIATGAPTADSPGLSDVKRSPKGIEVEPGTFSAGSGVFACGGAVAAGRMAARSVGKGRLAAESVHRFLCSEAVSAPPKTFDSHLGKMQEGEIEQLVTTDLATTGDGAIAAGPYDAAAVETAARCLQCDCGKKNACSLRNYAVEYGVDQTRYRTGARKGVARTRYAGGLVHEPGKCIDCGRCVGITAAQGTRPGVAFHHRGYDVSVEAPFGDDMERTMGASRDRCIAACPTGALWNGKNPAGAA